MRFSDNIVREAADRVHVKRSAEAMEAREELYAPTTEIVIYNVDRQRGVDLYAVTARDVKIGENIYTRCGQLMAYRVE